MAARVVHCLLFNFVSYEVIPLPTKIQNIFKRHSNDDLRTLYNSAHFELFFYVHKEN